MGLPGLAVALWFYGSSCRSKLAATCCMALLPFGGGTERNVVLPLGAGTMRTTDPACAVWRRVFSPMTAETSRACLLPVLAGVLYWARACSAASAPAPTRRLALTASLPHIRASTGELK